MLHYRLTNLAMMGRGLAPCCRLPSRWLTLTSIASEMFSPISLPSSTTSCAESVADAHLHRPCVQPHIAGLLHHQLCRVLVPLVFTLWQAVDSHTVLSFVLFQLILCKNLSLKLLSFLHTSVHCGRRCFCSLDDDWLDGLHHTCNDIP